MNEKLPLDDSPAGYVSCGVCAGHGYLADRSPCRNCLGFGDVPVGVGRRP
jgi:hypothetical protein